VRVRVSQLQRHKSTGLQRVETQSGGNRSSRDGAGRAVSPPLRVPLACFVSFFAFLLLRLFSRSSRSLGCQLVPSRPPRILKRRTNAHLAQLSMTLRMRAPTASLRAVLGRPPRACDCLNPAVSSLSLSRPPPPARSRRLAQFQCTCSPGPPLGPTPFGGAGAGQTPRTQRAVRRGEQQHCQQRATAAATSRRPTQRLRS
jgi:hypothetical protein